MKSRSGAVRVDHVNAIWSLLDILKTTPPLVSINIIGTHVGESMYFLIKLDHFDMRIFCQVFNVFYVSIDHFNTRSFRDDMSVSVPVKAVCYGMALAVIGHGQKGNKTNGVRLN
uniref:Uncharacterized protein n=1 Tax=Ditylum brightwellii TaxID=49249 RepID=A0A7S4VHJ1_9STRA